MLFSKYNIIYLLLAKKLNYMYLYNYLYTYTKLITMINDTPTTFRFKFSTEFNDQLFSFAKIHQYDDRLTYKNSWTQWITLNTPLIDNETRLLKLNGYQGNIVEKMFKSGRYYFRTKNSPPPPRPRRKYILIDKDIIDLMDQHIIQSAGSICTNKPSVSYDIFRVIHETSIRDELNRLVELNMSIDDINHKLKKTYKNRHFVYKQQLDRRDYDRTDIERIDLDLAYSRPYCLTPTKHLG
jgi:hypothetical protein